MLKQQQQRLDNASVLLGVAFPPNDHNRGGPIAVQFIQNYKCYCYRFRQHIFYLNGLQIIINRHHRHIQATEMFFFSHSILLSDFRRSSEPISISFLQISKCDCNN